MTTDSTWRRIATIEFWLFLFPPWGLWLLYKDPVLSSATKRRVLFYTFAIPFAVLVVVTMLEVHQTQKMLNSYGG